MGRFSKLPYLGMKLGHLPEVPEVAHILSFYPRGSKLSLFSLYGQQFLRHKRIFKIAIFGHETLPLAKVPEVAHMPSFYTKGSKLSCFRNVSEGSKLNSLSCSGSDFRDTGRFSKLPYLGRSCTYTLFLP